jgi:hypothetical protein
LLNTKDTDPLSVFCVQSSAIQQFILPTEIIRAKSKPGNSNREVFPAPIVKPTLPSGSNGSYRKKKDPEVSVSFAESTLVLTENFRSSLPKRREKKTAGINESRFPTCLSRSRDCEAGSYG